MRDNYSGNFSIQNRLIKLIKPIVILLFISFLVLTVGCNRNLRTGPNYNDPRNRLPIQSGTYISPQDQYRLKLLELEEVKIRQKAQQEFNNRILLTTVINQAFSTLGTVAASKSAKVKKDDERNDDEEEIEYNTEDEENETDDLQNFLFEFDEDCDYSAQQDIINSMVEFAR